MKVSLRSIALSLISLPLICSAESTSYPLDKKFQDVLSRYFSEHQQQEYFSGAALSVYVPGGAIHNYYAGNTTHDVSAKPITAETLFQIGSITKSFTSAIVLQLTKAGKLHLNDTVQDWLLDYKKWYGIHVNELLNMTSGLPNYSDAPLWNAEEYKTPARAWTSAELISFAYPPSELSPPLKTGYFYSNTGYILTDLIIERAAGHSYKAELERTIKLAGLTNTFYPVPKMDKAVQARMADGYSYNQYDNPMMVGKSTAKVNLSWAAAAGGIVANSEDIIKWVKALFVDETLFDANQKHDLMQLISMTSGQPVSAATLDDNHSFGLGVSQAVDKELGRYWFYEGETLGFRAVYMYLPCNGVIMSAILNSATNTENDHVGELMKNAYQALLTEQPLLKCSPE